MTSAFSVASGLATVLVLSLTLLRRLFGIGKYAQLPPGPKRLPLIGNLLDMPTEMAYVRFREWSNIHGPVMYLSAAGTKLLILNTLETARDLLDKRSVKYSNRPHLTMLMDVIGWDWSVALMNPGKQFTQHRRVIHKGLTTDVQYISDVQEQETAELLLCLQKDPDDFIKQIEFWAKAIILRITYGYRPSQKNDRYIWLADECANAISQTGRPGAYLVDSLPFLRWVPSWMPGAGFKSEAAIWAKLVNECLESPMQYTIDNLNDVAAQKSYVGTLLQMNSANELGKNDETLTIKQSAAIVHTAGSDSVICLLQSFVLAMTLYPHVQKRAVEEILSVVGKSRPPNLNDRAELPYTEKILLETIRWSRPVPLGIAHRSSSDDVYRSMFIPAGTIVMTNIWSITRDPDVYPSPDEFLPERFANPDLPDPHSYVFGFGRRVCPGRAIADASVWLGIVSILSRFEISKAVDEKGREIVPEVEYTPGLICHPKPFSCSIKPRIIQG